MAGTSLVKPGNDEREISALPAAAADISDIDIDRHVLAVALDREAHLLADAYALELLGKIGEAMHRFAVDAYDHIAELAVAWIDAVQARALGRGAGNGA